MRFFSVFLCVLLVQCANNKEDKNIKQINKSTYATYYSFLKEKNFIADTSSGVTYQYNALGNFSHSEMIEFISRIESFPETDKSLVHALNIAGLNLTDETEKVNFVKTQILHNDEEGTRVMLFISNYLKLKPTDPYFISAFRTIAFHADKNFLKKYLERAGYLKFNRFTDEFTTYNPSKLAHLPKGLVDTLLMKVDLLK